MEVDFDELIEKERERNNKLVEEFGHYLKEGGLSQKTINKHISNIDFYLNDFLLYYGLTLDKSIAKAEDGIINISYFLGDWFIRKALWASENSIKENITSIRKFYKFMQGKGLVGKLDLSILNDTIKEEKNIWIETIKRYDDPDIDYEGVWDF